MPLVHKLAISVIVYIEQWRKLYLRIDLAGLLQGMDAVAISYSDPSECPCLLAH